METPEEQPQPWREQTTASPDVRPALERGDAPFAGALEAAAGESEMASRFKVFDLAAAATFRSEGPAVQVLWESASARLLLLTLQAGQQLHEHRTRYQALMQVISGHLMFTLEHERISMRAGTLLHLAPRVAHSVAAQQDSILLLTLIAPSPGSGAELASDAQQARGGGEG